MELTERDPATRAAYELMIEVIELEERGDAGTEAWSSLLRPIVSRIQRAVELAPNEPDLLFLAATSLYKFAKVDREAGRLLKTSAARLEKLGGPTEFAAAQVGGPAEVERRMALIRGVTGSGGGCALAALAVPGVMVVVLGSRALGHRRAVRRHLTHPRSS